MSGHETSLIAFNFPPMDSTSSGLTLRSAQEQEAVENPKPKVWCVGTLTYSMAGLVVLFCWLLWGDFAWSMRDRAVPSVITLLFKKFDASDTLTGLLMGSLPPALAMIITPIVSYKSDRHRGRWGRRIPFLVIPTPIIVISLFGLALSPRIGGFLHQFLGEHSFGRNATVLITLGAFWTMFELACITANSVFGALVNDVVPQPVLGRFFAMFRALSLIAGIIFNYWMLAKAETHYVGIFLGIALLYGAGFTIMCLKVKEGKYPPPPEPKKVDGIAGGFIPAAVTYFRECFGKPYYLWFFAMTAASGLANSPVNVFSLFYAKSINMSMGDYGKCIALTYGISLALAYPLGSLADRFHPIRISLVTLGLYGTVMLWAGLCVRDTMTFGIAFVAHGVLAGAYFTASASLGQKLLPQARFAELMSACGIVSSLCYVGTAPCMGLILDHTGHIYRYTFYAAALLSAIAVVITWVMHGKFMALGGARNYVAPE